MFSSLRPDRWPLRARLVAAMTALLTLAFIAVGVVAVVTLDEALHAQIDKQLIGAAGRSPKASGGDCAKPPKHDGFPQGQSMGTLSARTCDGTVTSAEVLSEPNQPQPDLSPQYPDLLAVPVDGAAHTLDLGDTGKYRVVAQRMGDGAILITGLPLGETQQTLYLVSAVVVGAMVLVLLSVGVAGSVIVRRALRPLSRVAATATRVSQMPLDRGEVELPQRVSTADTDPRTEVGQVGAALNRMLDNVRDALEARHASETQVRQFVADASHELRTPLAAIRGYAELSRTALLASPPAPRRCRLEADDPAGSIVQNEEACFAGSTSRNAGAASRVENPELDYLLQRMESEAYRMTGLVEDMLLLARLDAGRPLAHEPVDLTALVVDVVSDARAAGPGHRWRLELAGEPVVVTGDPARLHQVLANLLTNARVHTPEGTVVTVAVEAVGGNALLRVTDDGPGIPDEQLPHVFERFARGDESRSRSAGSTGLGLAIVQAVVTAHKGTVSVTSAPGRTSFVVGFG